MHFQYNFVGAAYFFLVLFITSSSGGEMAEKGIGGPCEYVSFEGQATVVEVKKAPADSYNCRDAVEVIFSFIPEDPSATASYRFADHPDVNRRFTVGAGMNPPREWAQRVGLVLGSSHRCIRKEIVKGACVPVSFVFPDIDLSGWEAECFPG